MLKKQIKRTKTGLALAAVLVAMAADAHYTSTDAAPKVTVKTLYYGVHGTTSRELLNYMLRHGPNSSDGRAIGTASAKISQSMRLAQQRNRCDIVSYNLSMNITLRLPKLASGQRLQAAVRNRFNSFAAYVRKHEHQHKAMFVSCARRIEQRVQAISRNQSCERVRAKMRAIFTEENRACDRKHEAFDAQEAKRVHTLPFIRQASQSPRRTPSRQARRQTGQVKAFLGR